MKYEVDGWSNFCRVFEVPSDFPHGYCFGGGKPVNFQMVDWFHPVPGLPVPAVPKKRWREEVGSIETKTVTDDWLREHIIPFLKEKNYMKKARNYLVWFDFGAVLRFWNE